jgi:O-acetyl-ADP-ribose deacetylase (regulator of RNase III)
VAFPSVSTGAYGYPVQEAAEIAVTAVVAMLPSTTYLNQVRFVLFDVATCNAYIRAAEKLARANPAVIFEKGSS